MRFVVVDHSINGEGGHYLSYALSVLDAAKSAGHRTALVTGIGLHPSLDVGHEVVRCYRYDFFGNSNHPRRYSALGTWLGRLATRVVDATLLRARFFGVLPRLIQASKAVVRFIVRRLYISSLFYSLTGIPLRQAWHRARAWVLHVAFTSPPRVYRKLRLLADVETAFRDDTLRWLRSLKPDADDVILLPTISFKDCAGLLRALRAAPEFKQCQWRLLFRRNLYPGDPSSYQPALYRDQRTLFSELGQIASLYTDSEELSRQYNLTFARPFEVLPIPHTKANLRRAAAGECLVASYIGDARSEKGFHLLPRLVSDSLTDPNLKNRVRFAFQSNYNVPEGEPQCVVAKSQLESMAGATLTLLDRALSVPEYDDLLASSNIGLMLYERENYFARTSGVLVEYLSAGIPVIVPSRTWLAAQFQKPVAAYQAELLRGAQIMAEHVVEGPSSMELDSIDWQALGDGEAGIIEIALQHKSSAPFLFEGTVMLEDYLGRRRAFPYSIYGQPNVGRASRLIRGLPGICRVRAVVRRHVNDAALMSLRVLKPRQPRAPISVIGMTFDSPQSIASCLAELVEHFDHYRQSALSFSVRLNEYHNPRRLLELTLPAARSPVAAYA